MDVSVVVVTYNPKQKALLSTLKSIICQKNIEFEIIIADDGSKDFDSNGIELFFERNRFSKYHIVHNEVNQGTMINALSGWSAANGKYIKQLSPGDFLYDDHTLRRMYDFIEKTGATLAFGAEASYKYENNIIEFIDYNNPKDIRPYLENNEKAIRYNYVAKRQFGNGMAFIVDRDKLLRYAALLQNKVKYGEDFTYLLMVGCDEKISYMNCFVIWYEYGIGISTNKENKWFIRLDQDKKVCYEIISKNNNKWRNLKWKYYDYENENIIKRYIWKVYRFLKYNGFWNKNKENQIVVSKGLPEPNIDYLKSFLSVED